MMFLLKSLVGTQSFRYNLKKPLHASTSVFLMNQASSSPQISDESSHMRNVGKPLSAVFDEAVGLCPRPEEDEIGVENNELKKELLEIERELVDLKKAESGRKEETSDSSQSRKAGDRANKKEKTRLYALFTDGRSGDTQKDVEREKRKEVRTRVFKELSSEMELFLKLLYREGYFNKANFLPGNRLDSGCFDNAYARDYIKFAAETFGKDHQEIAKWLSGSDLKKIALFGCSSDNRRSVFPAKRLRKFFEIREDTVCGKCVLRDSCKFVNQSVWKGDTKSLTLANVMRVVTPYALDLANPELQVPDEILVSVNRLLKEVMNLSQTVKY